MMVTMTCCNSHYATVVDSMNHTCPVPMAAAEPTMPVINYECTWTTVEMERHGAHSEDRVDVQGNVVRWQCQGF